MINLEYLKTKNIETGVNGDVVSYINSLYDSSSKMFLKQHKDWYINERFVRGEHWIVYNKTTNKIQPIPVAQGEVRRTVNKIRTQVRGVKNFIKRSQPRWECQPNNSSDEAYEDAKKKNKILQNIYRTRQIKSKLTDLIVNSLKYSVGILEGGITKKNGSDYLDFWVDNTFDVVFDPYATSVQDSRFIFKTFIRPLEAIKGNGQYNSKNLESSDNKEAASEYKNILELEKYSRDSNKNQKDLETIIVKELWIKSTDEDGNNSFRVITIAGNNVLRVYEPKYKRYPFFIYNPEKVSDAIYSDPWIKDLISPNKSLDKTVSQIEAYIQRMLAGKWLIKKGVEVSTITDRGAEKIYYKGSTPPTQQNLQPLPAAPFNHVNNLERWIEESGGAREASLGRVPGSLQSGKAVEALQAADASVVSEPVENLELFLQDLGEFILEVISMYTISSEKIMDGREEIKYIGVENLEEEEIPSDVLQISADNEVKVVIVPEVAYSETEKKEWLMRLAEAKLIDEKTVLERFQFSNIEDIIERVQKNKDEQFRQEMVKQKESHRTDGAGPQDTADMADQENMQMAAGQQVPETPRALWTPEHTNLHIAFIAENQDAYNQHRDLFDSHILVEKEYA